MLSTQRFLRVAKQSTSVLLLRASFSHESTYHDIIDATRTEYRIVEENARKRPPPIETLAFGRTFTDHMLVVDWNKTTGWSTPLISEHTNFSISPAALGLHYAIQCFEGMKAYVDKNGHVRLFRPEKNMKRLSESMERMALPALDQEGFLECVKQLVLVDKNWIPRQDGYSLYIRPAAIGTSPYLGVQAPSHGKVYCILSPVGPYYPSGFAPVKLYAGGEHVRAWPGGVGNVKCGGNYAPTIALSRDVALKYGCDQIMWLFGDDHTITEGGGMNIFLVIRSKTNPEEVELITAPLSRNDILPGVTRDSILNLAKGWEDGFTYGEEYGMKTNKPDPKVANVRVSERFCNMAELLEAERDGRLMELFCCGTAAIISPVRSVLYNGREIKVPTGDQAGPIAAKLWEDIITIQYGRVRDHPWSVLLTDTV